jgi:hypothetical protein
MVVVLIFGDKSETQDVVCSEQRKGLLRCNGVK